MIASTPPIDGVITFLPVADLSASHDFYGSVLGLDLVLDQGTCRIYRITGETYVGVCTHLEAITGRSVILTLVTDDVDGWCAVIEARGGTIAIGPRQDPTYRIRNAFVHDPDGNIVEIQRFDDPAWASTPKDR